MKKFKFVFLVVVLISGIARAQQMCFQLFQTGGQVSNYIPDQHKIFEDRVDDYKKAASLSFEKPSKKWNIVSELIAKSGVDYEIVENRKLLGLLYRPYIRILPSQKTELNKLASAMQEQFNTQLVYDPYATKGNIVGSFKPGLKLNSLSRIYLSDLSAATGKPDLTLMHEIRHASMTYKERQGQFHILNGMVLKWKLSWPWGKTSESSYKNYINVQEASTWYQAFVFQIKHIQQMAKSSLLDYESAYKMLDDIDRDTETVLADLRDFTNYSLGLLEKGPSRMMGYDKKGTVVLGQVSLGHFAIQHIPKDFVDQFAIQNNLPFHQLLAHFKTDQGKKDLTEISRRYLLKRLELLNEFLNRIENIKKNRDTLLLALTFHKSQNRPFEKISYLLNNLEANAEISKVSSDLPKKLEDASELNYSGLELGPETTGLKLKVDEVDFSGPNLEKRNFLASSLHMGLVNKFSAYIKFELLIQDKFGQEHLLILEKRRTSLRTIKWMSDLSDKGFIIKKIKTTVFEKSEDNPINPDLQIFLSMTEDHAEIRNFYRIQDLIQKVEPVL